MYCKQCGHRSDEKTEVCSKCGTKLATDAEYARPEKPPLRWRAFVIAAVAAMIVFTVLPRMIFRSELDSIGPTDKLRFLRALDHSEYKRVGQKEFRVEAQTLIVVWDLRWQTLPEAKQIAIVRIVGKAWQVVGGETTRFRIEGEDAAVAEYRAGEASIGETAPGRLDQSFTR